jgi:hypothetical protein
MDNNNAQNIWRNLVSEIINNRGLNINTNRAFNVPLNTTESNNTRSVPQNTAQATRHNTNTSRRIQSQYIESINDVIYEYNRNIREYQENMRTIINLIDNTQNMHNISNSRNRTQTRNDADVLFSYRFYNTGGTFNTPTNTDETFVPLTREEIARTTRTYGFTQEDLNADSSGNVCPISLETFQIGDVICEIRGCQHLFKRPMLMNWLRRSSRCPVCRYNINDYREHQSDETLDETIDSPQENVFENAISQMFQNILTSQNSIDASGNLLYEFEFPIYHNNYDDEPNTI